MPASPLAAALLGGNENATMMGVDPAIMQSLPDIQLGQSLEQGSLSTAPASPAQAGARLVQALVGQVVKHGAMSDLAKAMANSADEMAKIFPAGTPMGDALRSPSPMVRMTAMQQAGKAMLVGNEPYSLEPKQSRKVGSVDIATGSPALAGRVEAAEAPYKPGGEGVVSTPNGPVEIPLTAATRAAMQPSVQPRG